jgi:hypothetical protein
MGGGLSPSTFGGSTAATFFGVAPTGREGTSVETMLLTVREGLVTRIDVADNTLDLVLYLWDRGWPHPHNIEPDPLVVGVDRLQRATLPTKGSNRISARGG